MAVGSSRLPWPWIGMPFLLFLLLERHGADANTDLASVKYALIMHNATFIQQKRADRVNYPNNQNLNEYRDGDLIFRIEKSTADEPDAEIVWESDLWVSYTFKQWQPQFDFPGADTSAVVYNVEHNASIAVLAVDVDNKVIELADQHNLLKDNPDDVFYDEMIQTTFAVRGASPMAASHATASYSNDNLEIIVFWSAVPCPGASCTTCEPGLLLDPNSVPPCGACPAGLACPITNTTRADQAVCAANQGLYAPEGSQTCSGAEIGHYLVESESGLGIASEPCKNGTFCDTSSLPCLEQCKACGTCPENAVVKVNCAPESDVICECEPGFRDDEDGTCTAILPCEAQPCANRGICVEEGRDYTCKCLSGWGGQNCTDDLDVCDSTTCGPGTCVEGVAASYTCDCNGTGYSGVACEVQDCVPGLCSPFASCTADVGTAKCTCWAGFRGNGTFCKDVTAPIMVMTSSSPLHWDLTNGSVTEAWLLQHLQASDNSGQSVQLWVTGLPVSSAGVGNTSISVTALDPSGNPAELVVHVELVDRVPPTIVTTSPLQVEAHVALVDSPVTAVDLVDDDVIVTCVPEIDVFAFGELLTNCSAHDASNNGAWQLLTVVVADTQPPSLTLLGNFLVVVEAGSTWHDPGYVAMDVVDGNVTSSVGVTLQPGTVLSQPGETTVTYSSSDAAGNTQTKQRVVVVVDKSPPDIVLQGSNPHSMIVNVPFSDPGASAWDIVDGDVTDAITQSGVVNTSQAGTYRISYTVQDARQNSISVFRDIVVYPARKPVVLFRGGSLPTSVRGEFGTLSLSKEDFSALDVTGRSVTPSFEWLGDPGTRCGAGSFPFRVLARDQFGLESSYQAVYYVATPPQPSQAQTLLIDVTCGGSLAAVQDKLSAAWPLDCVRWISLPESKTGLASFSVWHVSEDDYFSGEAVVQAYRDSGVLPSCSLIAQGSSASSSGSSTASSSFLAIAIIGSACVLVLLVLLLRSRGKQKHVTSKPSIVVTKAYGFEFQESNVDESFQPEPEYSALEFEGPGVKSSSVSSQYLGVPPAPGSSSRPVSLLYAPVEDPNIPIYSDVGEIVGFSAPAFSEANHVGHPAQALYEAGPPTVARHVPIYSETGAVVGTATLDNELDSERQRGSIGFVDEPSDTLPGYRTRTFTSAASTMFLEAEQFGFEEQEKEEEAVYEVTGPGRTVIREDDAAMNDIASFLYPVISRVEAEQILAPEALGAYIVRRKNQQDTFAISVKVQGAFVHHLLKLSDNSFSLNDVEVPCESCSLQKAVVRLQQEGSLGLLHPIISNEHDI